MITDGIISRLNEFFPNPDIDISDEKTEQGFVEPYFFVQRLPDRRTDEVDHSYKNSSDYDIQYFLDPDADDLNQKYEEMGKKLYQILKYITLKNGRIIRGIQMWYEIQDKVLHFYVTYICYLMENTETDKMQTLDVKESVIDE